MGSRTPEQVTLLFTDLVSSTEMAQRLGEEGAEAFRRVHFALLRTAFGPHGGREVKNLGDGLMVAFAEESEALSAAVGMQRAVADHNRSGGEPFAIRVGLQAGKAVPEDGDYFGAPVIVAKRLCDRAVAAQILTTHDVTGPHPVREIGALRLKGITDPVPSVEVMWDGIARTPQPDAAPSITVVRPPTLAPPPDQFFGRDGEMAALTGMLQRNRLVTIVGPGGVGKTRLSGHLVDVVAPGYPDGVWCCALASVVDDAQVTDTVATALRVERRAGVGLVDRVVEFLAPKHALLVLDNCEQIVDGAAEISAAVLAGTKAVDVLVTSREALGVPGEQRLPLQPLAVPGNGGPAVALFMERAASARGAPVSEADVPSVRELCRRVDGLPLAIELAAARVTTRTVAQIVTDVTERLADLGVRRGRPERQRSIQALVDWSYDLLDEPHRRLFERMAVFAGGADLEAVAAVARETADTVVERLQTLADQSLVSVRSGDGGMRYALLEPVRAVAEQRLRAREQWSAARDAHAAYFVDLAERAAADLAGPGGQQWMSRLAPEVANLRSVRSWALRRDDPDLLLRLAGAMLWWAFLDGTSELHAWAEEAADRYPTSNHPALPLAMASAGMGALQRGDRARAEAFADRLAEASTGEDVALRFHLHLTAVLALFSGQFDRVASAWSRVQVLSRSAGDPFLLTISLGGPGIGLAYSGRHEDAARLGDAALAVAEASGNEAIRAFGYYYAGEVRRDAHPEQAAPLLDRAVAAARRAGNQFILGVAGLSALSLQARAGDPSAAIGRYAELIERWQRAGIWPQQWLTLRNLVETLARLHHDEPAAVLFGAMEASALAPPLIGADAERMAPMLERLRERLGEADLERHQQHGAALGDTGAVAYARQVLREIADGS